MAPSFIQSRRMTTMRRLCCFAFSAFDVAGLQIGSVGLFLTKNHVPDILK